MEWKDQCLENEKKKILYGGKRKMESRGKILEMSRWERGSSGGGDGMISWEKEDLEG